MNFKDIDAPTSTETFNKGVIEEKTGNIYQSIVIMGKRAEQINQEMKSELIQKLDEFASHTDSLEEIFENREQIEVSKFYERLPKPTSIAIKEWMSNDIYYRNPNEEA
ncbi:DNA-directed RNA polymerase subunit omega [Moheibacter lacus]|uniref:DNA-directed RNA polymerase subunit omega n=1 Tax=Moheibacter lacus TaxID=2745851 RepID=A0A838ZSY9_9FLAO|nr:DNA-directed RNA polymerase subunit omega [Moheibacter lacus]MBA5630105.1 DNA-directed RNA polymerase subunit omega [Moheibacter lacus]